MDESDIKPALHGWLILDKPLGTGSTPCVSAVKRALREGGYAKVRVGHGGTLDPLATGVLPIALGDATKLAGRMLDSDKIYEFAIGFGSETDTLDAEGAVIGQSGHRPSLADVKTILPQFIGTIAQIPPKYSALKIDGKPAYARARAGEDVEMKTRTVTIHALHIAATHDTEKIAEITLTAHVSKGTYIRSLARDIARALDTVGHVTMLHRIKAGPFALKGAISLDKLVKLAKEHRLEQALLPLVAGLDDIPALSVAPNQARQLRMGQRVIGISATAGLYLATDQSVPVALVECDGIGLKTVRGLTLW